MWEIHARLRGSLREELASPERRLQRQVTN